MRVLVPDLPHRRRQAGRRRARVEIARFDRELGVVRERSDRLDDDLVRRGVLEAELRVLVTAAGHQRVDAHVMPQYFSMHFLQKRTVQPSAFERMSGTSSSGITAEQ